MAAERRAVLAPIATALVAAVRSSVRDSATRVPCSRSTRASTFAPPALLPVQ